MIKTKVAYSSAYDEVLSEMTKHWSIQDHFKSRKYRDWNQFDKCDFIGKLKIRLEEAKIHNQYL